MYQNICFYSFGNHNSDQYLELFTHKLENIMQDFIGNFNEDKSLKMVKINRLSFVQFLRAFFGIDFQDNRKN